MDDDTDLRRFESAVERLSAVLNQPSNSGSQSTINVNAGGAAVWIAVAACGVMLAVNIALAALYVTHDRKIDDLQHYIHAIYMMAPQLKPKDK